MTSKQRCESTNPHPMGGTIRCALEKWHVGEHRNHAHRWQDDPTAPYRMVDGKPVFEFSIDGKTFESDRCFFTASELLDFVSPGSDRTVVWENPDGEDHIVGAVPFAASGRRFYTTPRFINAS